MLWFWYNTNGAVGSTYLMGVEKDPSLWDAYIVYEQGTADGHISYKDVNIYVN